MPNVYFELTREFNGDAVIAVLGSGQAVVHYRIAMMSKDGDWILRESPEACARILEVLEGHGARYRPGAPLDVRWLRGGWSSHFEFLDEKRRRIRCDFFSRPPRVPLKAVEALLAQGGRGDRASRIYLCAFHERGMGGLPLGEAHAAVVALAEDLLPLEPGG